MLKKYYLIFLFIFPMHKIFAIDMTCLLKAYQNNSPIKKYIPTASNNFAKQAVNTVRIESGFDLEKLKGTVLKLKLKTDPTTYIDGEVLSVGHKTLDILPNEQLNGRTIIGKNVTTAEKIDINDVDSIILPSIGKKGDHVLLTNKKGDIEEVILAADHHYNSIDNDAWWDSRPLIEPTFTDLEGRAFPVSSKDYDLYYSFNTVENVENFISTEKKLILDLKPRTHKLKVKRLLHTKFDDVMGPFKNEPIVRFVTSEGEFNAFVLKSTYPKGNTRLRYYDLQGTKIEVELTAADINKGRIKPFEPDVMIKDGKGDKIYPGLSIPTDEARNFDHKYHSKVAFWNEGEGAIEILDLPAGTGRHKPGQSIGNESYTVIGSGEENFELLQQFPEDGPLLVKNAGGDFYPASVEGKPFSSDFAFRTDEHSWSIRPAIETESAHPLSKKFEKSAIFLGPRDRDAFTPLDFHHSSNTGVAKLMKDISPHDLNNIKVGDDFFISATKLDNATDLNDDVKSLFKVTRIDEKGNYTGYYFSKGDFQEKTFSKADLSELLDSADLKGRRYFTLRPKGKNFNFHEVDHLPSELLGTDALEFYVNEQKLVRHFLNKGESFLEAEKILGRKLSNNQRTQIYRLLKDKKQDVIINDSKVESLIKALIAPKDDVKATAQISSQEAERLSKSGIFGYYQKKRGKHFDEYFENKIPTNLTPKLETALYLKKAKLLRARLTSLGTDFTKKDIEALILQISQRKERNVLSGKRPQTTRQIIFDAAENWSEKQIKNLEKLKKPLDEIKKLRPVTTEDEILKRLSQIEKQLLKEEVSDLSSFRNKMRLFNPESEEASEVITNRFVAIQSRSKRELTAIWKKAINDKDALATDVLKKIITEREVARKQIMDLAQLDDLDIGLKSYLLEAADSINVKSIKNSKPENYEQTIEYFSDQLRNKKMSDILEDQKLTEKLRVNYTQVQGNLGEYQVGLFYNIDDSVQRGKNLSTIYPEHSDEFLSKNGAVDREIDFFYRRKSDGCGVFVEVKNLARVLSLAGENFSKLEKQFIDQGKTRLRYEGARGSGCKDAHQIVLLGGIERAALKALQRSYFKEVGVKLSVIAP